MLKDIIQIPPNSAARNFNECDILGQVKRDEKGNIATAKMGMRKFWKRKFSFINKNLSKSLSILRIAYDV